VLSSHTIILALSRVCKMKFCQILLYHVHELNWQLLKDIQPCKELPSHHWPSSHIASMKSYSLEELVRGVLVSQSATWRVRLEPSILPTQHPYELNSHLLDLLSLCVHQWLTMINGWEPKHMMIYIGQILFQESTSKKWVIILYGKKGPKSYINC